MDRARGTVLTNAERMVLITSIREHAVSVRFEPQARRLQAMGLLDVVAPGVNPGTHRVVFPSHAGRCMALAYVAQSWCDLWAELGLRLQTRAAYSSTPKDTLRCLRRAREANRRAMAAAVRCWGYYQEAGRA